MIRKPKKILQGMPVEDGAGVKLTRIIGTPMLDHVDPFLMLDQFKSENSDDYIAGFPPHPHRGFETVTYMKHGRFRHRDSKGHEGLLEDGSVQWMTAGRGIVHSEMPEMKEGLLWGFQLWVNLPSKHKMIEPRYQDIGKSSIPVAANEDGLEVRVIAGEWNGVAGPADRLWPIEYYDVHANEDSVFAAAAPENHSVFAFVYSGSVAFGPEEDEAEVTENRVVLLGEGEQVRARASAGSGFLFLSGQKINEPIARYGPFVMNTEAEIMQAVQDYQNGTLYR